MKPKILIVDDEKLNAMTFEAFLSEDGYELYFAQDGRTAIDMARAISPDLIILDVMMPEMDGFTVCRTLREDPNVGRVPIIIVTALHDSASRLEGLRAGADDFVAKPCSREEMRARVRTIVSLNRFRTIAEERMRFERLYAAAPIGIVLTDAAGVVLAANPLAETLIVSRGAPGLVGDLLAKRLPASERQIKSLVKEVLAHGSVKPRAGDHEVDGEHKVLYFRATVISDGGQSRAMLMFSDVTGEMQARQALEQMNHDLDALVRARTRQLQDANALLLSYASFVSHDIRSPLSVVKGYLSMVCEGAIPLQESGPMIDNAYKATLMMQELVQNILQLAHDEHDGGSAKRPEPIEPEPLVRHVWMHMQTLYPQLRPQLKVSPLPTVTASPLLVERVFYNLLSNALKYSASRNPPVVEVGTIETPTGQALFVRDNGVGFDERDGDKLFREFSRLGDAPEGDGLGLGLSLVARLVKAHGGRMWAEGKVGIGATFYVQFGKGSVDRDGEAHLAASA